MMRRLGNKKGQNTLEYLLILAGIIAALIVFKTTIETKTENALDKAGDAIENASGSALENLNLGGAWE